MWEFLKIALGFRYPLTARNLFQNSVPKAGRPLLSLNVDSKKKSSSKSSPWKRSFAQFLKRKRQSPRCNNGNNNNNDCATSPMLPANHNGCSPTSPVSKEVNNVQATLTSIGVITSGDLPGERTADVNCKGRGRLPTENNVAGEDARGVPTSECEHTGDAMRSCCVFVCVTLSHVSRVSRGVFSRSQVCVDIIQSSLLLISLTIVFYLKEGAMTLSVEIYTDRNKSGNKSIIRPQLSFIMIDTN